PLLSFEPWLSCPDKKAIPMKGEYRLHIFSISSQITESWGIMRKLDPHATHKINNGRDRTGPRALRASPPWAASQAREEAHGAADISGGPPGTTRFAKGNRHEIVAGGFFFWLPRPTHK